MIGPDDLRIVRDIEMRIRRCWTCGTFWSSERDRDSDLCPRCAGRAMRELGERILKLERTVAGLRGALSRRGSRRGS